MTAPLCIWCDEPIEQHRPAGDVVETAVVTREGENTVARVAYLHAECNIRQLVGSVGHQRKQCSCYLGERAQMDDPPGVTRREAARAAAMLATMRLPVECD
jgi:hypothetical protein